MTSPVKLKVPGRKPGKVTESQEKQRKGAARKKDAEGYIKSKSEGGKKGGGNIAENHAKLTPEQKAESRAKKSKPQLKPSEWAEIVAWWESGEVTLKELAEKFNRDQATISRYFTLNGIIKGSKAEEYSRLIREKIAEELAGDPGEVAKRIKQLKETYLGYNELLNKLTYNEIASARSKGLPLQSILQNIRALKEAASVFAATQTSSWQILGVVEFEQRMEREDIPELLISELTSQDIEQMRVEQLQMAALTGEIVEADTDEVEFSDSDDIIEEGDE